MAGNRFGHFFEVTSFGESHGVALGVLLEGTPAGVTWNQELLLERLARRRPGSSSIVSARQEADLPEVLSGVFDGKTLGTPIAIIFRNVDARSEDYKNLAPRPGHADDVWIKKYKHVDPRGGGRSSGRETISRVAAGAVAEMMLTQALPALTVQGRAEKIGPIAIVDNSPLEKNEAVQKLLESAKVEGRSYGGVARIEIQNVPAGLGQPVFHKIKADLAAACLSVGATTGFEFGDGFASTDAEGTEFHRRPTSASPYGGIRGGLTTGEPSEFRVAFKPTSTVLDAAKKGRHDPCIVPRAIPVLEAMAWLVLADHWLASRLDRME